MVRRILHITTLLQGGAGRIVSDLACAQRRDGHDVAVACAAEGAPGYEHYPAWLDALQRADVPLLPVHCTFRRSLGALIGAVQTLDRSPFVAAGLDFVHAHAAVPALVGRTLAQRVPLLATMHGWNAEKAPEHAATDVAVYNGVARIAVPSIAAAEHLRQAGVEPARVTVVPYGITPPAATTLGMDDAALVASWRASGRLVLTCVGSVGSRKRQTDLLEAVAAPDLRDRVACAFVGEGPELESFRDAAARLGVGTSVAVLGRRDDVGAWFSAADAAVFPSGREGLPVALLEAASLGCTVVASDIPEHRGVVSDGDNGLTFAVGDVRHLAETLRRLLAIGAAGRRTLAQAGQRRWAAAYRFESMQARYHALYREVIDLQTPAGERCR